MGLQGDSLSEVVQYIIMQAGDIGDAFTEIGFSYCYLSSSRSANLEKLVFTPLIDLPTGWPPIVFLSGVMVSSLLFSSIHRIPDL